MTKYISILLSLAAALSAQAQTPRVLRTQFVTYDTREDAVARRTDRTAKYVTLSPEDLEGDGSIFVQRFDAEPWTDCNTYLHIENSGSAYTLALNGRIIAEVEDDLTPAEFMISDALVQGMNTLAIIPRESAVPQIQNSGKRSALPRFADSYIFAQRKTHVEDFAARIVPDSTGNFARLYLDVIVANNFNYEEPIAVGYDITSPSGKLIDYTVRETLVAGHSRDTIRITTPIYDAQKYVWGDNKGDAPLYSLTLYIKRNSRPEEYIPFKIGYGITELTDGGVTRLGRKVVFMPHRYQAAADRKTTRTEIAALKREGINTLITEFPQPEWFYDECDRAGVYVLDRAAINAVEERENRDIGGTPSNDPALADEYCRRIDAMYYRMRNHTCIAGFLLGGESGNGYAMYKAYQHLKSAETERPVIYYDARGEWNSDL